MLFPEEDAHHVKAWIVTRIKTSSDADSDDLARYLADYVIEVLKHDGDEESVRRLCDQEIPQFLKEGEFLKEDPKQFLDDLFRAITNKSYKAPTSAEKPARTAPSPSSANSPESSRKRRFDDRTGPSHDKRDENGPNVRAFKQARRGRRGRGEDRLANQYPMGMMLPPFGSNNPMEAIMRMQAMGMTFPPISDSAAWLGGARGGMGGRVGGQRRKRCKDFDIKGFCSRGSTCLFDHGGEDAPRDEYDSRNAMVVPFAPQEMDMSRGRNRKSRQRGGRKGGGRAPFSAEGPVNDQSKSTIVVENIPEEQFSKENVQDFFSQFGTIVEISMQPYKHLAIVKYDKWASASNAYRSPKVIFDNRFVKVFWYKEEKDKVSSLAPNGSSVGPRSGKDETDIEPELDMEEFQRKQEEAQKLYREREDKRSELQRQQQELEKQQQELLAKHQAETERLQAKLAEKNGGTDASSGSSGADLLRAKLAALEQEAKILGIDPDAADEMGDHAFRGGHGGRGGYRGRGIAPRARGSFRGQAGRHAAYAQFSIDNRSKKLAITGVDFTPSDKDEQLRHFLLNTGEFESVDTTPSITHVSFRDRKTAERFYFSLHGKELPGINGKLELSWVNTPLPPVNVKKLTQDESGAAIPGDVMVEVEDATEEPRDEQVEPRAVNMDYEVGDDYGWEG
ncbi:hypothetical protein QQS21_001330 [Conoideocrella luteorostrata]|uniref:CCCH zinc finger and RRM domain-containing protein n=1 Tax=Conoideocrella luteorostrata TaxID=1105319 RepID=A0AAJ0D092_9HYPO|nr:hypothetical protein QQS21_001330 [Conoideocrella luteorostrata]